MKISIVRGESLNKWEMQNFELLTSQFDLTACVAVRGQYPLESIALPIKKFSVRGHTVSRMNISIRVARKLGWMAAEEGRLIALEKWLSTQDVAHAAETKIPWSEQAIDAKTASDLKVVLTCWETIPFAYEQDPKIRARAQKLREQADLFLPTTERAAQCLRFEGVDAAKIRVVMPGVDIERFQPSLTASSRRADYGLEPDDLVMLFAGRLIPNKGARELLVALRAALDALPTTLARRIRLLVAGAGPEKPQLLWLIEALHLKAHVQIIGGFDYMAAHELHQIADVFVLPSIPAPFWEEQYGMVLVEALACGVPVISTRSGGIPEVVGEAGILVPPLEIGALADAMTALLRESGLRQELSARARARAVQHFDSRNTARLIAACYHEVCNSGLCTTGC